MYNLNSFLARGSPNLQCTLHIAVITTHQNKQLPVPAAGADEEQSF